jgi:Clostripain family
VLELKTAATATENNSHQNNFMPTQKKWTVMVYIAGDNNLDSAGTVDLNEMKRVGTTDQLNVIAQFDSARAHGTKRYCLKKGGSLKADEVDSLGTKNTGDPKNLSDFIAWGVKDFPAEHYLLVLWNHGQGWDDTDIYADERSRGLRRLTSRPLRHALFRTPVRRILKQAKTERLTRAILLDDGAKDFLDNLEMKAVLAGAKKLLKRKVDILGLDACLMSMAEVGYQVKDSVDFTVGSEQTEPGDGWPYHTILTELAKNPALTPRAVSLLAVNKYLASYGANEGVTQSACDLAKSAALAAAVKPLAAALSAASSADAQKILAARTRVQTYEVKDYVDLVDLCGLLVGSGVSAP